MSLRLTVSLHTDETAMSFVSRLAARNGSSNARSFCLDWDLRFQAVVNGNAATLSAIAELGGTEAAALQASAFVATGPATWTYRGEELVRPSLRRARIAICPACALADIKDSPSLKPRAAVYGRAAWLIDAVKTCLVHRIGLVVVSEDLGAQRLHDFALHVAPSIERLPVLEKSAPRRPLGALERYVIGRLNGERTSPFLDGMPLHAAIRLCETAGAVALFGPKTDHRKLSDDQWLAAGGRGCADLAGGPEAVRQTLDTLKAAQGGHDRQDGPHVSFGQLYDLLNETRKDPTYAPVREIMDTYIRENFALEPRHQLFGKRLKTRLKHSVHTLAKQSGIHPKRLRKHLLAAGLIGQSQAELSDHNVLFDAAAGAWIATELVDTVSLPVAREHLNVPRSQMDVLLEHGFIKPARSMAEFGGYDRYSLSELNGFLGRLLRKARPVTRLPARAANIPDAARQACCSATEVVRLILDGQVEVLRLRSGRGYMAVHVIVRQVLDAVRGPETGLSIRKVATRLRTSDRVVEALIRHKHLASYTALNPVNRCPQVLVNVEEVEKFEARFVSLYALARQLKRSPARTRAALDAAAIHPALDPTRVKATFYSRGKIRELSISK